MYSHVGYVFVFVFVQYFENDDPDLYTTKIQYIRDNDVSDLELVFAEEEFSDGGTAQVSGYNSLRAV